MGSETGMRTIRKALAWMLTLCLLVSLASAAGAETVYIWVGVLPGDSQDDTSTTGPTITGVSVKLDGRTLMDGMCVNGSEPVTFDVSDSVTPNTYTYWLSTDGVNFSSFAKGSKLGGLLPSSTGTLYTVYFKVVGDNDPTNNVTVASYHIFFADISSATISNLTVKLDGAALEDNTWVNGSEAVTFSVTDAVTSNTYTYQLSTDGVNFTAFSEGDSLSLTSSSQFQTVYFRAIGADAPATNVKTVSYALYFDNVKPTLLCMVDGKEVRLYAADTCSGFVTDGSVANVSFDGGATWTKELTLYGQDVYSYLATYARYGTIAANMLAVRDRAGNVAYWGSAITLSGGSGGSGGGTGGTGGQSGGGTSSTTTIMYSYAASTYTTVTPYNGVDRVVEDGEMTTLTIGDQALDLSLVATDDATSEGTPAGFTAAFTTWGSDGSEVTDAEDSAEDTLVLRATNASAAGRWEFNGSVYKALAASGIDYLVLEVGDQITALSTAGFTAGIRYNLLRAAGLASKAFDYSVFMDQAGAQVGMSVEGSAYTLSSDHTSELYYYDLYIGSRDMMGRPFGQGSEAAADDRQG
jgi:hypothetical protein